MKAIDLGLPSGLKWADCNVGAKKETDYGLYFQWGDIVGFEDTTSHSDWETCPGNGGNDAYDANSISDWDTKNLCNGVLKPEVDAAHVHMGGNWRMPTNDEIAELFENTINEYTKINGVKGRKFISKVDSSKYIFLPFAGHIVGGFFDTIGLGGCWWGSSVNPDSSHVAYYLGASDFGAECCFDIFRCYAISVRGVCE